MVEGEKEEWGMGWDGWFNSQPVSQPASQPASQLAQSKYAQPTQVQVDFHYQRSLGHFDHHPVSSTQSVSPNQPTNQPTVQPTNSPTNSACSPRISHTSSSSITFHPSHPTIATKPTWPKILQTGSSPQPSKSQAKGFTRASMSLVCQSPLLILPLALIPPALPPVPISLHECSPHAHASPTPP